MPNILDHFMYAASDLDAGIAAFERLSGVRASAGGVHPGRGTRNALATLGDEVYLEIIAPDPKQRAEGNWGADFAALTRPQIFTFIAKSADLDRLKAVYESEGVRCEGPVEASRKTPDGAELRWTLLIPDRGRWGRYAPLFIDWQKSPHPAARAAHGCTLRRFEIGHPEAEALAELYRRLDLDLEPRAADAPYMRAVIESPNGPVILTGG